VSGDDDTSPLSLTVGHAACYASSRRPRSPPPWAGFGLGAPDGYLRPAGCQIKMGGATGRDFLRRRPQTAFGGPLGGTSGDALRNQDEDQSSEEKSIGVQCDRFHQELVRSPSVCVGRL
jgi:hypothetical protein